VARLRGRLRHCPPIAVGRHPDAPLAQGVQHSRRRGGRRWGRGARNHQPDARCHRRAAQRRLWTVFRWSWGRLIESPADAPPRQREKPPDAPSLALVYIERLVWRHEVDEAKYLA